MPVDGHSSSGASGGWASGGSSKKTIFFDENSDSENNEEQPTLGNRHEASTSEQDFTSVTDAVGLTIVDGFEHHFPLFECFHKNEESLRE